MNQKALILSIPVIFAVFLLGGWLLLREPKSAPESQNPPVAGENSPKNAGNLQPPTNLDTPSIDTSQWKTYRNEEYGFELKYPVEYDLDENNQWPRLFQAMFLNAKSAISFQIKVTSKDTEGNESFNIYLDHLVTSKSSLSGKEANLFVLEKGYCDGPGCSPPIVALKVDLGNRFLVLDFTGVRDISEDFPQMVMKSFRFLP